MSINQRSTNNATNKATHEEKSIYRSMPRAVWVSAVSAAFAVLIAVSFGVYSLWQSNQLFQRSAAVEEIHAIDVSPAEILASLKLGEQAALSATASLAQPSPARLSLLDQGDLPTVTVNGVPAESGAATILAAATTNPSVFAVVDGHIVPVAAPIVIQSGDSHLLCVRLPAPSPAQSDADEFVLEPVDYAGTGARTSISPTHALNVSATGSDPHEGLDQAGQTFTISLTTTKGSKSVTIIVWNNY